jgi:hypothetical protein
VDEAARSKASGRCGAYSEWYEWRDGQDLAGSEGVKSEWKECHLCTSQKWEVGGLTDDADPPLPTASVSSAPRPPTATAPPRVAALLHTAAVTAAAVTAVTKAKAPLSRTADR